MIAHSFPKMPFEIHKRKVKVKKKLPRLLQKNCLLVFSGPEFENSKLTRFRAILPLKKIEYGVYGDLIKMYPSHILST